MCIRDRVRIQDGAKEPGKTPDADVLLHQKIYDQNPKIGAIAFAQPVHSMVFAVTDMPVSYTHLDVYKRQPMRWNRSFVSALEIEWSGSFMSPMLTRSLTGSRKGFPFLPSAQSRGGPDMRWLAAEMCIRDREKGAQCPLLF